ncbi:hypothetical protein [Saprospira grandis]|uniref:hypothetical protein n=1 Tax=Saprospira grandis TaxID=1008 RepID=UPI0009D94045
MKGCFWGLPPAAAGPLQGSQVCSALQPFGLRSGLRPPFQAPRPSRFAPLRRLRRLLAVAAG